VRHPVGVVARGGGDEHAAPAGHAIELGEERRTELAGVAPGRSLSGNSASGRSKAPQATITITFGAQLPQALARHAGRPRNVVCHRLHRCGELVVVQAEDGAGGVDANTGLSASLTKASTRSRPASP
jgi:hypothetical protein